MTYDPTRFDLQIDLDLATRARQGDSEAWEQIITKSSPSLRKFLNRSVWALAMDPEDVAQHFWLKAYQWDMLKDYDGRSPLAFWFRRRASLLVGTLFHKAQRPFRTLVEPNHEPDHDRQEERGLIGCDPEAILMYNQMLTLLKRNPVGARPYNALIELRGIENEQ